MGALRDFVMQLKKKFGASAAGGPHQTPVLQSIAITPDASSIVGGQTQQFTATGTFSDGSTQDLTATVAWSSSATEIIAIDPASGLAKAVPERGTATITATDATSKITGSTTVTAAAAGQTDDKTKADMQTALTKKPPDKAALKKLVKERGGRALDDLVQALPDPPDRAEIVAAVEARFGIKMTAIDPKGKGAAAEGNKSLKQLYEMMLKVPEADVRDNPSLKEIERSGDPTRKKEGVITGDVYYGSKKKIYLDAYAVDTGHPAVGDPSELPDVEENSKPKGIPPQPAHLDWNSLHEVGHAVDDRLHFMDGKLGNAAFGGWKNETVDSVAAVAAAFFTYDQKYIKACLTGPVPKKAPPAPAGTDAADWETHRQKAVEWCAAVVTKNELWDKGAESVKRAIDGRVYHEQQKGYWVSYDVDARKKGITGYQFRAPGEWFAELYAAYHLGKLKDSNPNMIWLKAM